MAVRHNYDEQMVSFHANLCRFCRQNWHHLDAIYNNRKMCDADQNDTAMMKWASHARARLKELKLNAKLTSIIIYPGHKLFIFIFLVRNFLSFFSFWFLLMVFFDFYRIKGFQYWLCYNVIE